MCLAIWRVSVYVCVCLSMIRTNINIERYPSIFDFDLVPSLIRAHHGVPFVSCLLCRLPRMPHANARTHLFAYDWWWCGGVAVERLWMSIAIGLVQFISFQNIKSAYWLAKVSRFTHTHKHIKWSGAQQLADSHFSAHNFHMQPSDDHMIMHKTIIDDVLRAYERRTYACISFCGNATFACSGAVRSYSARWLGGRHFSHMDILVCTVFNYVYIVSLFC